MDMCRKRILHEAEAGAAENVEVEIHFFLVALLRFYRAIALAHGLLPTNPSRAEKVEGFHRYLGIKRTMRNVGEHFDDYLIGRGHQSHVDPGQLQVWSMETTFQNVRFSWLGETFDLKRTMDFSNELWASFIKDYRFAAEAH